MRKLLLLVDSNATTSNPLYYRLDNKLRKLAEIKLVKNVKSIAGYAGVIVSSAAGVDLMKTFGAVLSETKESYGKLVGASVVYGGTIIVACPSPDELQYNRVVHVVYLRLQDRWLRPHTYAKPEPLDHVMLNPSNIDTLLGEIAEGAMFMSVDLETNKLTEYSDGKTKLLFGATISLVGMTFVRKDCNGYTYTSYTTQLKSLRDWEVLKEVMACPIPKVFHNGQYDITYLVRWGMPPKNYLWDTMAGLQANTPNLKIKVKGKPSKGYYSLFKVSGFYLLDNPYWKDGLHTTNFYEFSKYCATDCMRTAMVAVMQLESMTKETFQNYVIRFAALPACTMGSMRGFLINKDKRIEISKELKTTRDTNAASVKYIMGVGHNDKAKLKTILLNMQKVAKEFLKVDDIQPVEGSGKDEIKEVSRYNPIFEAILKPITKARSAETWHSTYVDKAYWRACYNGDNSDNREVMIYKLDPFGTDTGRLSSSESSLWVGTNAQNVPPLVRAMCEAPKGWRLFSTDAPQSETRTTAYLSRNEALRAAVESGKDFHSVNCSAFFGVPYESIYNDETKEVLNKVLRDTGKRTNHGANYNMGAWMLLQTMGANAVRNAQRMLKLPEKWSLRGVCAYLLARFDVTYKGLRTTWYSEQIYKVLRTGRLSCVTGYSPVIIDSPVDSQSAFNTIVATEPQHWSAFVALKIYMRVLALELTGYPVKTILQIHDETVGAIAEYVDTKEFDELIQKIGDLPQKTRWDDKVLRIPVGIPVYANNWKGLK